MKAHELMIGDWVKFTSKYGYGTGQVVGIEPREGSAEPTTFTIWKKDKEGNTKFFVGVSKNCVKPIPLTAEILEKNGFVNKKGRFMQKGNFDDPPLILWHLVDDEILKHPKSQLEIHYGGKSIHMSLVCIYVHELQHALRLCGIEKEIVL